MNIQTLADESGIEKSGIDLYFLDHDVGQFKATILHEPYFYLDVADSRRLLEVSQFLQKQYEGCKVEMVEKEDLDLANHLVGRKHKFLKMSFNTVSDLVEAKSELW